MRTRRSYTNESEDELFMYIQRSDFNIKDFLEAVNFICPKGYDINYFILPKKDSFDLPINSGFSRMEGLPEDESIVYKRTPPIFKKDFAQDPVEYSVWEPKELGKNTPSNPIIPKITDPSELDSPFIKVHESMVKDNIEVSLRKRIGPFPVGSFFKMRLNGRSR